MGYVRLLLLSLTINLTTLSVSFAFLSNKNSKYNYKKKFRLYKTQHICDVQDPENILTNDENIHLQQLIKERANARWQGDYEQADTIRDKIQRINLPKGYRIHVEDIPRKQGGGSKCSLVQDKHQLLNDFDLLSGPTILQLAHAALGLAVQSSTPTSSPSPFPAFSQTNLTCLHNDSESSIKVRHVDEKNVRLQSIMSQVNHRLLQQSTQAIEIELGGRKAADAAFWFALAGVTDSTIFEKLADICANELERFGARPSCRLKDIYQILERFAAAGVQNHKRLENVALDCLDLKLNMKQQTTNDNINNILDLHSDHCLLMIWKFSTKQKKRRAFLESAKKHWERHKEENETVPIIQNIHQLSKNHYNYAPQLSSNNVDWSEVFKDPMRPLVVDVGCGMGVSLLGLASIDDNDMTTPLLINDWSACNFVGVDLGGLGIGYAQGLSTRLGLSGRLQFVVDSADNFIQHIRQSYPGPVELCLVQFPTPYRLPKQSNDNNNDDDKVVMKDRNNDNNDYDFRGNSQLPQTALDGFMVSPDLLSSICSMLQGSSGKLILQSNCEDVAVWMRNTACHSDIGFEYVTINAGEHYNLKFNSATKMRVTQRTLNWIEMGGERAIGNGWITEAVLPRKGSTETEVACMQTGTPVYRCLLTPKHV